MNYILLIRKEVKNEFNADRYKVMSVDWRFLEVLGMCLRALACVLRNAKLHIA